MANPTRAASPARPCLLPVDDRKAVRAEDQVVRKHRRQADERLRVTESRVRREQQDLALQRGEQPEHFGGDRGPGLPPFSVEVAGETNTRSRGRSGASPTPPYLEPEGWTG